ncbi:MAG: ABC transporter substrate-binding protein [Anaerolineae bacterium]
MTGWRLVFTTLLLVLASIGCGNPAQQAPTSEGPRPITLAMGFVPNVQFTPVYVALERGYFAEEGLDVTLDYGMETDLLEQVGVGNLRFAIASGDQVIMARANGLPVRYVLNWYRRFPVCVVALADSGIETPDDLVGKRVGIPALKGASYIGWQTFAREAGLEGDVVDLQVVGYTQVASLTEGRIDAAICYAMNEPVQLRTMGYEVNSFFLDDYTSLPSNGIITNDDTIAQDPDLVRALNSAFLRGLQDTLDDPDAAFAIARKAIPEMDDETAVLQRAVLDECVTFWQGEPLGQSSPASWEQAVQTMRDLGYISGELDPTLLYTNDLLPAP